MSPVPAAALLQRPRRGKGPCAIAVKVKIEHFNFEGDSVTARPSSSARLPGRSRSTAPTTLFCLPTRRPSATWTLGGGNLPVPERDFGRKDKIVKINLRGDGEGMQAL